MSIIITDIQTLYGIQQAGRGVFKGAELGNVEQLSNAWLSIHDGLISGFGKMETIAADVDLSSFKEVMSVKGKSILPTWCDSHTHIVFAGSREDEFVD
jgi:imidazolonepropionase